MPMPKVTTNVTDLTTRISSTGTYNSAIVIAAKKGPVNTPVLVTSQTDLLERYTPNEKIELGWDGAYYEAWTYLASQSNLYVVRAAAEDALYGGCLIKTTDSDDDHKSLEEGFTIAKNTNALDNIDFDYENDALLIYGADQGDYNNNISVAIITDPDEVKTEGCFMVRVYKDGVAVEEHICSLDPSFKNGYGVNCFTENTLKTSLYVRGDVNDDESLIKTSYEVSLVGTVTFDTPIIKVTNAWTKDHKYEAGDCIKSVALENADGFYECIQGGYSSHDPVAFASNTAYYETVEDNECVWALREILKPYTLETNYDAKDIVTITKGSKVMRFRAMVEGVTGTTEPEWFETDEEGQPTTTPKTTVDDGTITWANLDQTETVMDLKGYTFKEAQAGTKLNLDKYDVYSDYYLASPINRPETTYIDDPTTVIDERSEGKAFTINYTATYTGNTSVEHYVLPKPSKKQNGAYVPTKLAGGSDGTAVQDGKRIEALKTLGNLNDINIQLVMDGGNTTPAYHRAIDDLCNKREQSCKGIISTPYENELGMLTGSAQADILTYRRSQLNANTRNLELYTTHQLIYDEFNDRNVYVSPGCFVAARIMNVAQALGWHWAAAGYNRGVINSLDVANTFETSEVDTFSDNQINTIIKEPGMGNVIFDELTLLNKACDLQDAHITRWIDIYLRPRLKTALKSFLFEFNDEITRLLITKMIDNFMQPEVASRACYEYRVVCDETNNKPNDIQNNILNCWLFVKPTKLAKFIKQEIIIAPNSADLSDIEF